MRIATTGSGQYANIATMLETATVQQLWGSTATTQVKLRRNASFNTTITIYLQKSATVDAGNGATWTSIGTSTITNANLPTGTGVTDWVTATVTGSIPNDGTANSLRVLVAADAATGAGAYWEMAQAQLEVGSIATPFARAGGTIQGELAACQRYYYKFGSGVGAQVFGSCYVYDSTRCIATIKLAQTMRTTPTLETTGTASNYRVYIGATNITSNAIPTLDVAGFGDTAAVTFTSASTSTVGYAGYALTNGNNVYLGFSAEL
jgi:hypothetical protein